MNLKPTQIIILAAGLVLLVFSFLEFQGPGDGAESADLANVQEQCESIDRDQVPEELRADFDEACGAANILDGFNAWSGDAFAPVSTWPALIGLALAGVVAATAFGKVKLPEHLLGFTVPQAMVGLAFAGFVIMFGFLITGTDGSSFGAGFWLMLLGSIALLAGTVMQLLGVEPGKPADGAGPGPSAPPAPF